MEVYDRYCTVSGGHHECHISAEVLALLDDDIRVRNFVDAIALSDDERAAMEDIVLIGPFDSRGHACPNEESMLGSGQSQMNVTNLPTVRAKHRVRPGQRAEYGIYESNEGSYLVDGASILCVQLSAYRILLAATRGRVDAQVLWETAWVQRQRAGDDCRSRPGLVPFIDYGTISRSHGQYCSPELVRQSGSTDSEYYATLIADTERTPEEQAQVAIMGAGNLWVFRRPDRFPVREAFCDSNCPRAVSATNNWPGSNLKSSLAKLPSKILVRIMSRLHPTDLVSLLESCKSIPAVLTVDPDRICRGCIARYAPHLLPHAVGGPGGDAEIEWWFRAGGRNPRFPWLAYTRACARSPSMRNRERIWGIAKQLEAIVLEAGTLDFGRPR